VTCPHPCYIGASYAGCGWAWIYECQEWGEELGLVPCVQWTGELSDAIPGYHCPHLCTHGGAEP
jgi:hypothetical protein